MRVDLRESARTCKTATRSAWCAPDEARLQADHRRHDEAAGASPARPDRYLQEWIDTGRGIYTTNGAVMALWKSARSKPHPDLFIFGLITNFRGYYPGYSEDVSNAHRYFTWTILKGYTHNTTGRVAIRTRDPQDVPDINFNYFDEASDPAGEDVDAVAGAIEFVRSMSARYRDALIEQEEVPGDSFRTRAQLRQFVRDEAWGHHASCTCKIGRRTIAWPCSTAAFASGTKGCGCRRVGLPASGPVHRGGCLHGGRKGERRNFSDGERIRGSTHDGRVRKTRMPCSSIRCCQPVGGRQTRRKVFLNLVIAVVVLLVVYSRRSTRIGR